MRSLRTPTALALVLCLAGTAGAVEKAGKGAKKGKHPVHGKVVAVQKDDGKDSGTITIQVHHKKKGAAAAAPAEKTFKVSSATKYQLFQGKKGAVSQKDAAFADIKKGTHVMIVHKGEEASDVKIIAKGKAKKGKAKKVGV
jgi:hypothetical protein